MKITTTDLLVAENEALVAENEALKAQLKDIMYWKNWIENGGCHQHIQKIIDDLEEELAELKQQQLYKEDFEKFTCFWNCCECEDDGTFYLKDNSKYDKLPSKEEK
ncbi:hypothetical protein GL981_12245 (plasmid) [Spiroplasma citri]|uniref:Uncharacterized protein n=1 Tax=Spiroplasma citri TaxID=2133 RepID=A0AAJ4EJP8_SPICI|nr:DUF3450 domain-containing protein [Spiroplasma citri]QIA68991.1 hypothetical protein GL298_05380 [Spiroplasma citri]QIA70843.1 hypothetical protein GL981_05350 [Spiroplasma citri]QIA71730.1 hypothetical protein GL981_10555 [Spiroplasma citri]QIA72058.1 hypothetical protein GL981_12245 [Spiroplasma citri]